MFETPGHGAWDFNDAGVFVVTLVALVQPAPTSRATTTPAAQTPGTETVSLQLSANPSDGTLTGTFTSQTRDVNGTVTSSEQGTVQGARILAQTPTATGTTPATGATSTPGAPSTVSATSAPTTVFGNMPSATSVFGAQPTP